MSDAGDVGVMVLAGWLRGVKGAARGFRMGMVLLVLGVAG